MVKGFLLGRVANKSIEVQGGSEGKLDGTFVHLFGMLTEVSLSVLSLLGGPEEVSRAPLELDMKVSEARVELLL